jgi:Arc/MetJ-type ribon-helix-helix transcriptional regulator
MSDNPESLPAHLRNVPPQLRQAVDDLVNKSQKGLGISHKQKPVSVMLPPGIDALVRSLPNRSDFIRQAIVEKLEREHRGEKESEATTPNLPVLEQLRDRVLMRRPPKERGKLRTILNEFIHEIRVGEGSQSIAPP